MVPDILRRGAAWFAGIGRPNNTGTKLFCISGHVEQAVQRRRGDGHPAARADRDACRRRARRLGQSARGHSRRLVDAARPPAAPVRRPARWISTAAASTKSALGTAAVIVMDKSTDIIRAMARISYFYKHESCGQCTPCREGMGWMWRVLDAHGGRPRAQARDRHADRGHHADRGPHHLRVRRRRRLAGAGPACAISGPRSSERIDDYAANPASASRCWWRRSDDDDSADRARHRRSLDEPSIRHGGFVDNMPSVTGLRTSENCRRLARAAATIDIDRSGSVR